MSRQTADATRERQRRLLAASRLHHMLLRRLGVGIDVAAMLEQPAYAGRVLAQCRALNDMDVDLQACMRILEPVPTSAPPAPAGTPAWASDTSGFGVSELPERASEPRFASRADTDADPLDLDLSQPHPDWMAQADAHGEMTVETAPSPGRRPAAARAPVPEQDVWARWWGNR